MSKMFTLPDNNSFSEINIITCYAFNCNSKATRKIEINCGNHGSLTIFVCESCSYKFKQEKTNLEVIDSSNTFNDEHERDKFNGGDHLNKNESLITTIPVFHEINHIVRIMIKTQDIFYVGFYPDANQCDINIYIFKNAGDVRRELAKNLENLNMGKDIKKLILRNFDSYSQNIDDDIKYRGIPHFWNIYDQV